MLVMSVMTRVGYEFNNANVNFKVSAALLVDTGENGWLSTLFLMSAMSDIDHSDIGRKYVGLKIVIRYMKSPPISTLQ
jgi:hypothetical protein